MTDTFRNYIGGEWVESKSGKTFANINPANTNEVVGHFQASTADDAQAACDAAAAAQAAWSATNAPRRGEYLFKAAELVESRLAKISEEMTREEGKTLPEAKGEVKRAINILRYFGGEGARQFSYQIPSERDNVFCYTMRKPLGVVALITPWNFPIAIPGLEAGARAGGGKHRGDQAGIAGAAQFLSRCGGAARGRNSRRRIELMSRGRAAPWEHLGGAPRDSRRLFYRLMRRWQFAL